jgi:hypothetical protein
MPEILAVLNLAGGPEAPAIIAAEVWRLVRGRIAGEGAEEAVSDG